MHGDRVAGDPQKREADRFAAELLTPSAQITPLLPGRLDLNALAQLGEQGGVLGRPPDLPVPRGRCGEWCNLPARLPEAPAATNLELAGPNPSTTIPERSLFSSSGPSNSPRRTVSIKEFAGELSFKLPRLRTLIGDPSTRPELRLVDDPARTD